MHTDSFFPDKANDFNRHEKQESINLNIRPGFGMEADESVDNRISGPQRSGLSSADDSLFISNFRNYAQEPADNTSTEAAADPSASLADNLLAKLVHGGLGNIQMGESAAVITSSAKVNPALRKDGPGNGTDDDGPNVEADSE